ncbi:hypothetical protein L6452_36050 [Arctium lappa]|uniref:Uncharacterized protein n=1 Tax=Arctium lappa TaxID=4217 RepID=A0ACB8Y7H4_ARCLA|nr:hypothetical protein L6452_36050 [Arctium lappa]
MNGGGSGAPVRIPADIVVIAPPKRRRRPSVRLDPKSSKTRPLVNLTTTAAAVAAVGGGVPITGEYQGTIYVAKIATFTFVSHCFIYQNSSIMIGNGVVCCC